MNAAIGTSPPLIVAGKVKTISTLSFQIQPEEFESAARPNDTSAIEISCKIQPQRKKIVREIKKVSSDLKHRKLNFQRSDSNFESKKSSKCKPKNDKFVNKK